MLCFQKNFLEESKDLKLYKSSFASTIVEISNFIEYVAEDKSKQLILPLLLFPKCNTLFKISFRNLGINRNEIVIFFFFLFTFYGNRKNVYDEKEYKKKILPSASMINSSRTTKLM